MGKIKCPKCKSAHIELIGTDANVKKTKRSSSLNINPLKPLTVYNHKEKKVKKKSAGKLAAGFLTGGASLMVTGTKSNKGREFLCLDCGKTFKHK
ncbi:MAG TPA: hypothetical protein VK085_04475 [Pseudogracilibacillus sp.]|nr:hypothetical protein [Pseudogracilibacillus sp.]